ncbi:slipin family protein [Uniformispora flossi]|uniref:slipin family protein n=1 Tax=Uniformispora flossi TaxID=3390723 RepID=UPI003C2E4B30
MAVVVVVVVVVALIALITAARGARVIQQYERGVVFRLGRVQGETRPPGMTMVVPIMDRVRKVNVQIVTMPVPAQEGITRDNVTVRVDAVVYFRVRDPVRAIVEVQDYTYAMSQVAQTSLRSIIGKSDLDDLLTNREPLNQGLALMLDSPAVGWGIEIDRVELKDVALPESMKRSMSRQAEAERERRSRIITADGELQASEKLAAAAQVMSQTPTALQLRLLQTIVEVSAEKNSTLILPFPVELLRYLDNAGAELGSRAAERAAPAAAAAGTPELPAAPEPAAAAASPPASSSAPSSAPSSGSSSPSSAGQPDLLRTMAAKLAEAMSTEDEQVTSPNSDNPRGRPPETPDEPPAGA